MNEVARELDPKCFYEIPMDEPNINLNFYQEFKKCEIDLNFTNKSISAPVIYMSVVHGTLKSAFKKGGWKVKEMLKNTFQLLHDTSCLT